VSGTGVRCLLRRAGVSRCSHQVYGYARRLLGGLLQELVHAALRMAEHGDRVVVTLADVRAALALQGKKLYDTGDQSIWRESEAGREGRSRSSSSYLHDEFPRPEGGVQVLGGGGALGGPPFNAPGAPPTGRPALVLRSIRRLQKNSMCLAIAKPRFERVVRHLVWGCPEVRGAAAAQVQVEERALAGLQEAAEERLVLLFKDALCCCVWARSTVLLPEDIRFAYLGMAQRHY